MILLLLAFWVAELNGLDAPGAYPKYAEKLELFGQLVSVWNVEVTYHRSERDARHRGHEELRTTGIGDVSHSAL